MTRADALGMLLMRPESTDMAEHPLDFATYVDQTALMMGLSLEPDYRPGVIDNISRLAAIAQLVMSFPLPDDLEADPVFSPLPASATLGENQA